MNKLLVPCARFKSCIFLTKPQAQKHQALLTDTLLISSESPAKNILLREHHSQFIFDTNTSYFNEGNQHHHNNSKTGDERAAWHKLVLLEAWMHQEPIASSY